MKKLFRVLLIIAVILASYMLIYTSSKLVFLVDHQATYVTSYVTEYLWVNQSNGVMAWSATDPGYEWIRVGAGSVRQVPVYSTEPFQLFHRP